MTSISSSPVFPATRSRLALSCILAATLSSLACGDTAVGTDDAYLPASVEVTYTLPFGANAGGPRAAYDKSDRLSMQFSAGSDVREQAVVDFEPSNEVRIPVVVRLRRPTEQMQFELEIRLGPDALFRGSAPVKLQAGRTTTVTVSLEAVIAGLAVPETVPTLTAYGETLQLSAASVFATGDTIDVAAATWVSANAGVATVDAEGTVVARSDGTTEMTATAGEFTESVTVRVLATVNSIVVSPATTSIPIGGTQQFSVTLFDRFGNLISGRAVSWSSTNPSVLQIDANGLATAVGIGTAFVTATVNTTQGSAAAIGQPGPPITSGLNATILGPRTVRLDADVLPNGGVTATWFEYDTPGGTPGASLTIKNVIGSSLLRVPVTTTLQSLLPATEYTARVLASSPIGQHQTEIVFTTPAEPPTVETLGVTDPTVPQGVLNGKVNPHGSPTTVWFEWGLDSLAISDTTGAQVLNGFTTLSVSAAIPTTTPGTVIFYRLVARNAGGTAYGTFRSFTVLPGSPNGSPDAVTAPAVINGPSTVTLNGSVTPNGYPTVAQFEWSLDPGFSTWMTTAGQSIGAGSVPIPVAASLFSLGPNTTLYFRAIASNVDGADKGAILSVTTPGIGTPPDVTTGAASAVDDLKATLNGTANANGSLTTVWFEYGTDPTLTTFTSTTGQAIGSGSGPVSFSAGVGLAAFTQYYFRAVASSIGGTVRGSITTVR